MQTDFRRLKPGILVIVPTFRCNLRCEHCQHSCSPERGEQMPIDLFRSVAEQALQTNIASLCISGGEPFLLPDHVKAAAALCRAHGRNLVIQTNGFWGRNRQRARQYLETLDGITVLGFSIDAAHLREIPLETVLSAMDTAIDMGITKMSVSVAHKSEIEFDVLKKEFTRRYPGLDVVGWPILPVGRAALHPALSAGVPAFQWDSLQRSCGAQLEFSPIVHPTGELHLCYRVVMALEQSDPLIVGSLARHSLADLISNVASRLCMFIVCMGGGGLGYLLDDSPFAGLL
ncbi:MAG: radical SAM protein, partial [Candidatus Omnitrophica bacterium]|nr:radical SAM protein [Candidatus Omnitrophota bacterium]